MWRSVGRNDRAEARRFVHLGDDARRRRHRGEGADDLLQGVPLSVRRQRQHHLRARGPELQRLELLAQAHVSRPHAGGVDQDQALRFEPVEHAGQLPPGVRRVHVGAEDPGVGHELFASADAVGIGAHQREILAPVTHAPARRELGDGRGLARSGGTHHREYSAVDRAQLIDDRQMTQEQRQRKLRGVVGDSCATGSSRREMPRHPAQYPSPTTARARAPSTAREPAYRARTGRRARSPAGGAGPSAPVARWRIRAARPAERRPRPDREPAQTVRAAPPRAAPPMAPARQAAGRSRRRAPQASHVAARARPVAAGAVGAAALGFFAPAAAAAPSAFAAALAAIAYWRAAPAIRASS